MQDVDRLEETLAHASDSSAAASHSGAASETGDSGRGQGSTDMLDPELLRQVASITLQPAVIWFRIKLRTLSAGIASPIVAWQSDDQK
jgi:hypothetical protein